jgi:hypothetical protein
MVAADSAKIASRATIFVRAWCDESVMPKSPDRCLTPRPLYRVSC